MKNINMKYEYAIFEWSIWTDVEENLNKLARDDWEVDTVLDNGHMIRIIFKRPKSKGEPERVFIPSRIRIPESEQKKIVPTQGEYSHQPEDVHHHNFGQTGICTLCGLELPF